MAKNLNDLYDYLSNNPKYQNRVDKIFASLNRLESAKLEGLQYSKSTLVDSKRYEAVEALIDFGESFRLPNDKCNHLYEPTDKNAWITKMFDSVLKNSSPKNSADNLRALSNELDKTNWLQDEPNAFNWVVIVSDNGEVDSNPICFYVKGITSDKSQLRSEVALLYDLADEE